MSQEPPLETHEIHPPPSPPPSPALPLPPKRKGLTTVSAFFDLPNPKILKLLLISSTTTFSSGIALAIEWALHGKHHLGFHWIIYYASFLISFPFLIGVIFLVSIYHLDGTTRASSLSNTQEPEPSDLTVDEEPGTLDHLAVVQTRVDPDCPAAEETEKNLRSSLVLVTDDHDMKRNEISLLSLRRTLSMPLPIRPVDHGNSMIRRTMS